MSKEGKMSFDASYEACEFLYDKLANARLISTEVTQLHKEAAYNELDIIVQSDCSITSYGVGLAKLIGYDLSFNKTEYSYDFIPFNK